MKSQKMRVDAPQIPSFVPLGASAVDQPDASAFLLANARVRDKTKPGFGGSTEPGGEITPEGIRALQGLLGESRKVIRILKGAGPALGAKASVGAVAILMMESFVNPSGANGPQRAQRTVESTTALNEIIKGNKDLVAGRNVNGEFAAIDRYTGADLMAVDKNGYLRVGDGAAAILADRLDRNASGGRIMDGFGNAQGASERDVPVRLVKVNRRKPINLQHASKFVPFEQMVRQQAERNGMGESDIKALTQKFNTKYNAAGVTFNKFGAPDFTNFAINKATVASRGSSDRDIADANKMAGYGNSASSTPEGYVWHHQKAWIAKNRETGREEVQTQLILIPSDVHELYRHTGADERLKELRDRINK
jgi:hypothetical protein